MPDYAAVRAAIVANVNSVPDVGEVYDHEPYAKNLTDMKGFYETQIGGVKQIRGWHLVRKSWKNYSPAIGINDVRTVWELRGFMGLEEERNTESEFNDLIESMRAAMRDDPDLGGVANTHDANSDEAGWQGDEINKVMFANVLCHGAKLTLITWHTE